MDIDISRKLIRCFAPVIIAEMLLGAASALFSYAGVAWDVPDAGICGLIAGHVLIALMCVFMLHKDVLPEDFSRPLLNIKSRAENVEPEAGYIESEIAHREYYDIRPRKDDKTGISRKTGISPAETAAWMACACALCLISTYLLNALGMTGADDAYIRTALVTEKAPAALRVLLVLLAAPVSEELLYRGIVYGRVTECFGEKPGFAASVAAFALSHGNLTQGIYACVTGVLLTSACRRVRSSVMSRLWLCILLHITINACSLMVFK